MKKIVSFFSCFIAVAASLLYADNFSYSDYINTAAGLPLFQLDYYNLNTGNDDQNFIADVNKDITFAFSYWADVLTSKGSNRNQDYIPINIIFDSSIQYNAMASLVTSETGNAADGYLSVLAQAIQQGILDNSGLIKLFFGSGFCNTDYPFPLPLDGSGSGQLASAMRHEIMHSLGMVTDVSNDCINESGYYTFSSHLYSLWEKQPNADGTYSWHKNYDTIGDRQLKAGMKLVAVSEEPTDGSSNEFACGIGDRSGIYFKGTHTEDVLTINGVGAVVQPEVRDGEDIYVLASPAGMVPVNGYEYLDYSGTNIQFDLSHIELARSLMSHQNWRNYTVPMEAELAILQDIGYDIDRRSFYGFSIYNSGIIYTNTNPYYARNASGTDFIIGKPSTTTLGVGLHIYGSDNTVTQAAPLLADGAGATGVRNDGSRNNISIQNKVTANGSHGTGILMSYGKDNTLTIENGAVVHATGENGVAVRFDIGHNEIGDGEYGDGCYRGSYMYVLFHNLTHPGNLWCGYMVGLDGPLAKEFSVKGTLTASDAAIYISDNTFVKEINIENGASIKGDIRSEWDPQNPLIYPDFLDTSKYDLHTKINFNAQQLTLNGSIIGEKSFDIKVASGASLAMKGNISAANLENNGNLTLATVSQAANVKDTFFNSPGAVLTVPFFSDGSISVLTAGNATLSGTLCFKPVRGAYYKTGDILLNSHPVILSSGEVPSTDFTDYKFVASDDIASPILNMSLNTKTAESGDSVENTIRVNRNSYTAYAAGSKSAFQVGAALDKIAEIAVAKQGDDSPYSSDITEVIAVLDWSSPDGNDIVDALPQLAPDVYNTLSMVNLARQEKISSILNTHLRTIDNLMESSGKHNVWAQPIATYELAQKSGEYKISEAGIIVGYDHLFSKRLTMGVHFGGNYSSTEADRYSSTGVSAFTGMSALYRPVFADGLYLYGHNTSGIVKNSISRNITIVSQNFSTESAFTSFQNSAELGAGFDMFFKRVAFGPEAALGYNLLYRPSVCEREASAALELNSQWYSSVVGTISFHASYQIYKGIQNTLQAELSAGYRRELTDGAIRTTSAFKNYESYTFTSEDTLCATDRFLLSGAFRLFRNNNFSAALDLNGSFGSNFYSYTAGIHLSKNF